MSAPASSSADMNTNIYTMLNKRRFVLHLKTKNRIKAKGRFSAHRTWCRQAAFTQLTDTGRRNSCGLLSHFHAVQRLEKILGSSPLSHCAKFSDNLILIRAPKVPALLPVGGARLAVIDLVSNEVDSACFPSTQPLVRDAAVYDR